MSSVTCWLFGSVLFSLHVFVFFTVFFSCKLYPVSYILLCSEKMLDTISIFLNLLSLICDPRCDLSWRFFHVHLRKMCILLFWDGMSWRYQYHVGGLMCHLRLVIHLVIFCCDGLSIGVSGVLNSPVILCYCCFPLL